MKVDIKKIQNKLFAKLATFVEDHSTALLLIIGTVLLVSGTSALSHAQESFLNASYDDGQIRNAVGNLFALLEGAFGALIMVVSGLGAIVSAAMGQYRTAVGCLVVAVGAFILRSLVSLFFGNDFTNLGAAG